jgi:general secretion pathway protein C
LTQSIHGLHSRRLVAIAAWLLVGVCALLIVRVGIIVVDGVDVEFQALEPVAPSVPQPARFALDWRLFGEPEAVDYGFQRALPATPLSLQLRGAVTGERGYAIIVDADGNEGVYRVGDEVPGQASVVTIEARRVVLERDGSREALALPGAAETAVLGRVDASRAAPTDRGRVGAPSIGSLGAITSRFTLDPQQLARQITILPVASGGFRVRAGRNAAVFQQLGFHVNDVVLAINGRPVDNRSDVRAVFEDFRPSEPLAITVRRGDRQLVLTPDLSLQGGAE